MAKKPTQHVRDLAKKGHYGNPHDYSDRSRRWAAVGYINGLPMERRFSTRAEARGWLYSLRNA